MMNVSAQNYPQRRALPCDKLFRKCYLIQQAENVPDYRNQIMSVTGKFLKIDSTKKVHDLFESL